MADYQQSTTIPASAEDVFNYVTNPENMPHYLPTVKHAELHGKGRIRVKGEAQGHPYDSDGDFHVDKNQMQMKWSSDGERDYHGELTISDNVTNCEVKVKLHFGDDPKIGADPGPRIEEGIRKTLQSIQNQVQGTGGKQEQS